MALRPSKGDGAPEQGGLTRWRLVFSGKVQHVGFRYTAFYQARSLGLTGWVDNLPDGRVMLEAQGEVVALRRLLLYLRRQPHIRITRVEYSAIPPVPGERRFEVRGYDRFY